MSHVLGQKRQFCAITNCGEVSVRFSPLHLRGLFAFPILRIYGTFWKLIPRIIASDESHFGQKRQFCSIASCGRISSLFPPTTSTTASHFSNLRPYGAFLETNFPNHHPRWVTSCTKTTILRERQRWADFCPIFARYNYECFSLFRFYCFTEISPELFSESSLPTSRIFQKTTTLQKRQRWGDLSQIFAH